MKKILFAASECVPFIKTGGLADVCGALPKTFDHKDWDVRVVIPNYSCIPEKYRSQFEYVTHFYMACGSYIPSKYVGVLQYKLDGVTYYFIDNQEYFNCFVPYGDMRYDIEKFTFFDKAVLSMLPLIRFRPDIIGCIMIPTAGQVFQHPNFLTRGQDNLASFHFSKRVDPARSSTNESFLTLLSENSCADTASAKDYANNIVSFILRVIPFIKL